MAGHEYNGSGIVVVCIVFLVLTYISVFLRCFVRIKITKAFSVDDWFMLAALANFTLSCIFILLALRYGLFTVVVSDGNIVPGLGHHNADLVQADRIQALKYQALATISYVSNMMFVKLAIALFLLRLAVKRVYVWILKISMAVVTVWSVAIFIYNIFQCQPVAAQWDFTILPNRCVSGDSFIAAAYSISFMTIVSDWMYALMPIFMIWSIQMSPQKKLTVGFVLSLGVFASIATLIRLKYLVELGDTTDILFTGTAAMVWTLVEPGVAITAASLVTIRPLLRALNFRGFDSAQLPYRAYPSSSRQIGQHISLRSDIPAVSLNHSVSCRPKDLKGTVSMGTREPSEAQATGDWGSEEFIMQGITMTTAASVTHDARSVEN